MKITLVMASDEEGGLEKHVLELAAGLSQAHEVSLIAHQKYQSQVESSVNFVAFDMSGSRYNPWTKYLLKKQYWGQNHKCYMLMLLKRPNCCKA